LGQGRYEPLQRFRLVELLDEVLVPAESEPRFRFTLDGQMPAVDDYLEVRPPENRERLCALVRSGQLAIGPWQILMAGAACHGCSHDRLTLGRELGPCLRLQSDR
jgi:2-O-(6-phospho-alpha-D-mannosyl)-D-glycerate hydrolase